MATTILTKKKFIDLLQEAINDEDIILLTKDKTGTISVNAKRNEKKVTFSFAADAFKRKDDIADIAFGKTPVLAFSICGKDDVSDETLKLLSES